MKDANDLCTVDDGKIPILSLLDLSLSADTSGKREWP